MNATTTQLDADIAAIRRLPDCEDDRQDMIVLLLSGKNLHQAVRHTRAACARARRWSGMTQPEYSKKERLAGVKVLAPNFAGLDTKDGDDNRTLHEKISDEKALDPLETLGFKASRKEVFDDVTEGFLDVLNKGSNAVAEFCGVSRRMAQLSINQAIADIEKIDGQDSFLSRDERVEAVLIGLMRQRVGESWAGRKSAEEKAGIEAGQGELFGEGV